ncbi:MAG: DUF6249 domain-containing protein [Flavobacteriaceae bacterium]|nr:DUF6249 domain-containing protein [Flavobacteriaceae bacterium]
MAADILIPFIVFSAIFGIFYVFITTRNKERMALIEKGADASLFATKSKSYTNMTLKFGMLALGIGIGILAGSILATYTVLPEPVPYFSMIFLFGGLGLILNYLIEKNSKSYKE